MVISIVTVSFNSAKTIRDTIESVIVQNYNNYQYIVIDGGSTDGTLSILDEYKSVIDVIISEADNGIYDAMNKGVNASVGDVIGFLNSDDFFQSDDVLSSIAEAFVRSECDVVYGDVVFVGNSDLNYIRRYYKGARFKPWLLRFGFMPAHPSTYIKSWVYKQNSGFDASYNISGDFEFFVRCVYRLGLKCKYIDKVLVRMRLGGISTANIKNIWLMNKEIVNACNRNGIRTSIFLVLMKLPFKCLQYLAKPRG